MDEHFFGLPYPEQVDIIREILTAQGVHHLGKVRTAYIQSFCYRGETQQGILVNFFLLEQVFQFFKIYIVLRKDHRCLFGDLL